MGIRGLVMAHTCQRKKLVGYAGIGNWVASFTIESHSSINEEYRLVDENVMLGVWLPKVEFLVELVDEDIEGMLIKLGL